MMAPDEDLPELPPAPAGKGERFDREDLQTLRAMINEYRSRKAVRETLLIWGKYLLAASGVLIAISQFKDGFKSWLGIK